MAVFKVWQSLSCRRRLTAYAHCSKYLFKRFNLLACKTIFYQTSTLDSSDNTEFPPCFRCMPGRFFCVQGRRHLAINVSNAMLG